MWNPPVSSCNLGEMRQLRSIPEMEFTREATRREFLASCAALSLWTLRAAQGQVPQDTSAQSNEVLAGLVRTLLPCEHPQFPRIPVQGLIRRHESVSRRSRPWKGDWGGGLSGEGACRTPAPDPERTACMALSGKEALPRNGLPAQAVALGRAREGEGKKEG